MRFNWNIPPFYNRKSSLADGWSYCWSQIRWYQSLLVLLVGTDIKMWVKEAFSHAQQLKNATYSEGVQWRCSRVKLLIYLLAERTLSASPSHLQGKTFLFHPHPYLKRHTDWKLPDGKHKGNTRHKIGYHIRLTNGRKKTFFFTVWCDLGQIIIAGFVQVHNLLQ